MDKLSDKFFSLELINLTWRRVFGSTTRVTRVSSDNVNIAAEHQEPMEVLSQLGVYSPVYGE